MDWSLEMINRPRLLRAEYVCIHARIHIYMHNSLESTSSEKLLLMIVT
jgi:hypothetical protein